MTGREPSPPDRVESDYELLDSTTPLLGPLPGLAGLGLARRFPRTARVLGILLVVAFAAAWSGLATHGADQRDRATAGHSKVVLRLLGGAGTLAASGTPSANTDPASKVNTLLTFTLRNDGAEPVVILSAQVIQPGVTTDIVNNEPTALPGKRVILTFQTTVDCTRADLPQYPDGLHLTARSTDGKVTPLTLAIPQTTPTSAATSPGQSNNNFTNGTLKSYFDLCGQAGAGVRAEAAYGGLVSAATAAKPQFSYKVSVSLAEPAPRFLTEIKDSFSQPGLESSTDLPGPVLLTSASPKLVTITVRVTDCAAMAAGLSNDFGGDTLVNRPVLTIEQTDKRFSGFSESIGVDRSSALYTDFLTQIGNACPTLK
jgi:hypothetical protein